MAESVPEELPAGEVRTVAGQFRNLGTAVKGVVVLKLRGRGRRPYSWRQASASWKPAKP
jgi:hypothetical protein